MMASTNTIAAPLRMDWVEGESPLIHPAGPDCGLSIQAVMIVAATPPMMIARICWSLKRFFIAFGASLARTHGTPHHRNALRARKLGHDPGRRQPEDGAAGGAFDHKGAGAGAVGRRIGHRLSLIHISEPTRLGMI